MTDPCHHDEKLKNDNNDMTFRTQKVKQPFMRGSRKFCQKGSNFDKGFFLFLFFKYDEGSRDPNTTISGPSTARQRNAIYMAFRWRADDGPTLNAGLVAL